MKRIDDARIFEAAAVKLDRLQSVLEKEAPGLITGCHVTGSMALRDGRPDKSDIDLVLIRNAAFGNAESLQPIERALADLRETRPRHFIDGLVLTEADLAAGPDRIDGERPILFDNLARLGTDGSGRNPVTWQTLRQCVVTAWGEPINPARLWHDPARLDAWTRENLYAYWRPWLAKSDRLLSRFGVVSMGPWATEWGVLGVTRLHYTLATSEVTSKHGAGLYALEAFPERWHPIIQEAIHTREGGNGRSRYRNPLTRRREMRAFVAMVIEDALALPYRATQPP